MKETRTLIIISMISLSLLLGCASSNPRPDDVFVEIKPLAEGQGRIIFYVPKRGRHLLWKPIILLNGEEVGQAVPAGFFDVTRPGGTYEVAQLVTTNVQGKRGKPDERSRKDFPLKEGETLYIQMVLTPGAGMEPGAGRYDPMYLRPVLVEPVQAMEDLRGCRYTGNTINTE